MLKLYEDSAKAWLAAEGMPVPIGAAADTPEKVIEVAKGLPSTRAVVKALLPFGRRGKAGAVLLAGTPEEAGKIAGDLLGRTINDTRVQEVYVEECKNIDREFYLAFMLSSAQPQVVASIHGGVDIETTSQENPDCVIRRSIDPLQGLQTWESRKLWSDAGVSGSLLLQLADLTTRLYETFRRGDALLLEINPLAVDDEGNLSLVGAMAAVDPCALPRHPDWAKLERRRVAGIANERERHVAQIDIDIPGGECRYIELDGEIGLLVGGGGAGLYQHDLVLKAGSAPSNHSVTPPTGSDTRKLIAVIGAILDNPKTKALLVGFNFTQMARADIRVKTLVEVLDERKIDTSRFPVVIRLFGNGEEEARAAVAGRPGVHYMERGTSLEDAVNKTVELLNVLKVGVNA